MAIEQTNGIQNKAEQALKSGAEHARSGIDQAEKKGQEAVNKLADIKSDIKEVATEKWQDVKDAAKTAAQNVQDQSTEALDGVQEYVKKNPIKALGFAALAGAVVAAILRS
jgi:ElaB/YqjD/DUF883 family membrane-anchored ribosome-binding protein